MSTENTKDHASDVPLDRAAIFGKDGRWLAGWALRFIIFIVAGYLLWLGLGKVWTGLLPILLAIIVCTVLWPAVKWLRDHKFPNALAVATVMLLSFAGIAGIVAAIAPSIATQSKQIYDQSSEGLSRLEQWLEGPPFNIKVDQLTHAIDQVMEKIREQASSIASGVIEGVTVASSVAVTFLIVVVLTFFFLKDGARFLPWVRRSLGKNTGWHLTEVLSRTWNTLGGFIRAQAIISLINSISIGIGLLLLKVPLAFVLTILCFLLGFIPIVGSVVAGAAVFLVALVSNSPTTAAIVLLMFLGVHLLEGNVLSPIFQSKAMHLHPAIVLLSVTVGSSLFGIVGAFLAVPVAATIAVWMRYYGDLVSLRTGELTADDITIETDRASASSKTASSKTASEAFEAVRAALVSLGRRTGSE